MEKKNRDYRQAFYYDEEAAEMISEQITDAYQSGDIERDEPFYQPSREVGE